MSNNRDDFSDNTREFSEEKCPLLTMPRMIMFIIFEHLLVRSLSSKSDLGKIAKCLEKEETLKKKIKHAKILAGRHEYGRDGRRPGRHQTKRPYPESYISFWLIRLMKTCRTFKNLINTYRWGIEGITRGLYKGPTLEKQLTRQSHVLSAEIAYRKLHKSKNAVSKMYFMLTPFALAITTPHIDFILKSCLKFEDTYVWRIPIDHSINDLGSILDLWNIIPDVTYKKRKKTFNRLIGKIWSILKRSAIKVRCEFETRSEYLQYARKIGEPTAITMCEHELASSQGEKEVQCTAFACKLCKFTAQREKNSHHGVPYNDPW